MLKEIAKVLIPRSVRPLAILPFLKTSLSQSMKLCGNTLKTISSQAGFPACLFLGCQSTSKKACLVKKTCSPQAPSGLFAVIITQCESVSFGRIHVKQ